MSSTSKRPPPPAGRPPPGCAGRDGRPCPPPGERAGCQPRRAPPVLPPRGCRRVAAFVMVSVCWFLGWCERRGRKPKARGPGARPAEAGAAVPARLGPPAGWGRSGPGTAGAVRAACPAHPARGDARRGYVTRPAGAARGGGRGGAARARGRVLPRLLPLQALGIPAVLPPPPCCVHPWKCFRVKGLAPSPGTTGGCGPFQGDPGWAPRCAGSPQPADFLVCVGAFRIMGYFSAWLRASQLAHTVPFLTPTPAIACLDGVYSPCCL